MTTTSVGIRLAVDGASQVQEDLRRVTHGVQGLSDSLSRMGHGGAAILAGQQIAQSMRTMGAAIFESTIAADRLRTSLQFSTGNSAGEMAYLREMTNRLGLEFTSTAQAFSGFAAAAKGTSLEGAGAHAVFESISKAASVMGLSTDQAKGSMLAVQQMMSKGIVSAEEFRQQLGERMPMALQAAANATGTTTAEFSKLLESGKVIAEDFLPKFAKSLDSMLGDASASSADRLDASVVRMENAFERLKENIGKAGVAQAMSDRAKAATNDIDAISTAMENAARSGKGFWGQLNDAAAVGIVRGTFGLVQGAANLTNSTLNSLSGGALKLNDSLSLIPTAAKPAARQVVDLDDKLKAAWKEFDTLQQQFARAPSDIYLKSAVAQLSAQINAMQTARNQMASIAGKPTEATGSVPNPDRLLLEATAKVDAAALAAAQKEGKAYADLMGKMATDKEKFTAAVFDAKAALGSLYSPEIEARLREHYIKPTNEGINALANQKAKLEDAKQYAINLQKELQAIMSGEIGDGAKLTDSEKSAIKLQEQLQTSVKGAARASMEKQLAVALETIAVEKSNRITERQIQIQKDLEKHSDSELKSLATETVAIQSKTDALNAQLDGHGKSKAAIEESVLARMKENAADIAMFDNSGDVVAAINAKAEAQKKYVKALKDTDYKAFNEQTDELLRAAKEQQTLYQDELQLTGMTTLERNKIVAARAVELKFAKELDALSKSGLTADEKETQRLKLLEAKRIDMYAAEGKAIQAEFERISNQIEQSLTDALMRGFESGKDFAKNMRDTVVNMFKTMVLRPVISAIVNPVAGALTGALGLAGNANASTGGIGNITNLFSGGGDMLGSIGSTVFGNSAAYGAALGTTSFGAGSQAAMLAAQTGEFGLAGLTATSGAAGGAMASIGAALPWIGGALAIASLLKGFDDSGTIHTGGLAQYSAAGGTQTSTQHGAFGMGFGGVDYGQAGTALASGMAQTIVGILDTTATAFGKTAGYTAATAFADDTSKDGAWGGLLITNAQGRSEVNWNDTRTSRWAPKEFSDGEAGAKEYAAAVSRDVRNLLIEQTPDWADAMLNALGDAPSLDQLAATVGQINTVQMALVSMGKASEAFAGMAESATSALLAAMGGAQAATAKLGSYYTNFYTESERTALATQSLKVEMASFGKEMPATREAFKGLVDTAIAAGDTTLAASLLNVADKFAAIVPAAEDASVALEKQAAAMAKAADDAAKAAEDAMKTARSNALRQLEASVARESAMWQKQADAASSLRDEVGAVFDALASSIVDLRRIGSGDVASAVRGNQFIQDAIENAQAGLGLPGITDLNNAIQDAKSGLGMEQFSTVADQKFAALKLAGELDALKGVAGEQLTGAERQLRVAEEQLVLLQETSDYWNRLLDDTQTGIDATLSVASAVLALTAVLDASKKSAVSAGAKSSLAQENIFSSGPGGPGNAGPNPTALQYENVVPYYEGVGAISDYYSSMSGWDDPQQQLDNIMALYNQAKQMDVSVNQISAAIQIPSSDIQSVISDLGLSPLRQFANGGMHSGGLRLVGERGWEVEATGPARYWNQEQLGRAMSGGGQETAEVVAELRALRAQVDDLNRHSRRTAEAINGNPEAPIPMVAA